jgi:hypothetical protein
MEGIADEGDELVVGRGEHGLDARPNEHGGGVEKPPDARGGAPRRGLTRQGPFAPKGAHHGIRAPPPPHATLEPHSHAPLPARSRALCFFWKKRNNRGGGNRTRRHLKARVTMPRTCRVRRRGEKPDITH